MAEDVDSAYRECFKAPYIIIEFRIGELLRISLAKEQVREKPSGLSLRRPYSCPDTLLLLLLLVAPWFSPSSQGQLNKSNRLENSKSVETTHATKAGKSIDITSSLIFSFIAAL